MRKFFLCMAVIGAAGLAIAFLLSLDQSWNVPERKAAARQHPPAAQQARIVVRAEAASPVAPPERSPDLPGTHEQISPVQAKQVVENTNDELRHNIAYFKDITVPVEERRKQLDLLSQQADSHSTQVLMALGNERVYLNRVAVEALGNLPNDRQRPEVVQYLEGKLLDPDARVLCAALRSLGRQSGERAIPAIAEAMERNRVRPDGHQEFVLNAAVEALNLIHTPRTVPLLAAELKRSEEKGWNLEYGSKLVAALGQTGTPEGRQASAAYADRLAARAPADPLAGPYFAQKIAEAQAVSQRQ